MGSSTFHIKLTFHSFDWEKNFGKVYGLKKSSNAHGEQGEAARRKQGHVDN